MKPGAKGLQSPPINSQRVIQGFRPLGKAEGSDCHLRIHLYSGRPLRVPGLAVCIGHFQHPGISDRNFPHLLSADSSKSGAVSQLESEYDRLLGGTISYLVRANSFTGERGQVLVIPTLERLRLAHIILIGLGPIPEVQRAPAMAFIDAITLGAQVVSRIGGDQMHLHLSSFGGLWQEERELAEGLLDGLFQGLTGLRLMGGRDWDDGAGLVPWLDNDPSITPPYFQLDLWAEVGLWDIRNGLRWAAMQRRLLDHWQGWRIDLKFEESIQHRGIQNPGETPGEARLLPAPELAVLGLKRGDAGLNYQLALPDGQVINDLAPASPRTLRRWLAPLRSPGAISASRSLTARALPENPTPDKAPAHRVLEEYDNLWTRLLPADIKRVLTGIIEKSRSLPAITSHLNRETNPPVEKKCEGTSLVVLPEDENLANLPWEFLELNGHRLGLEMPLARCFKDMSLEATEPLRELPIHAVLVGSSPVISELRELPGLETTVLPEPTPLELLQVIQSFEGNASSPDPEILHIFNKLSAPRLQAGAATETQEVAIPASAATSDTLQLQGISLHLQGISLTARNVRHALGEGQIRLVWLAGNLQAETINNFHFARTWLAEGVAQAILVGDPDLEATFQVYQSLLEGQTIGQAVQTARQFAQKYWGPAGWMDFHLFGDPRLRLVKPHPGVGYAVARLLDRDGNRCPKGQPLHIGETYHLEIRLKGEIPLAYRGQALAIAHRPSLSRESAPPGSGIVEVLVVAPECRVEPDFQGEIARESSYLHADGRAGDPGVLRFAVCPEITSDPLGHRKPVLSVQFFQGDQFLGMIELEIPVVEAGHV
ncbi:MAG: hypothetical protein HY326_05660 [Chloroflexi bacterium]|nr:hypothetical protein [Chloroflexota bacterium]